MLDQQLVDRVAVGVHVDVPADGPDVGDRVGRHGDQLVAGGYAVRVQLVGAGDDGPRRAVEVLDQRLRQRRGRRAGLVPADGPGVTRRGGRHGQQVVGRLRRRGTDGGVGGRHDGEGRCGGEGRMGDERERRPYDHQAGHDRPPAARHPAPRQRRHRPPPPRCPLQWTGPPGNGCAHLDNLPSSRIPVRSRRRAADRHPLPAFRPGARPGRSRPVPSRSRRGGWPPAPGGRCARTCQEWHCRAAAGRRR